MLVLQANPNPWAERKIKRRKAETVTVGRRKKLNKLKGEEREKHQSPEIPGVAACCPADRSSPSVARFRCQPLSSSVIVSFFFSFLVSWSRNSEEFRTKKACCHLCLSWRFFSVWGMKKHFAFFKWKGFCPFLYFKKSPLVFFFSFKSFSPLPLCIFF